MAWSSICKVEHALGARFVGGPIGEWKKKKSSGWRDEARRIP